ncbi:MAG: sodium/glutamate symporter [Rhodobacteraceae bacterium]|nr:sodium/glutamate symporter [Paracoccaceae bacterium]QEW19344.1 Glutamate permease [Marinibacterium anthonyi]
MILEIPDFLSLTLGLAVFLLGVMLNDRFEPLHRFNIPEAVTGGLAVALVVLLVYLVADVEIVFNLATRDFLLVLFFSGIGLNARLGDLISGGKALAVLLGLTVLAICAQNIIGTLGAVLFGFPAQSGVLFGSAALIGGHGTAIAWAPEVMRATGLGNAAELGVAVATLGLVLAALVGGPVAGFLVQRHKLGPQTEEEVITIGVQDDASREAARIDHKTVMRALLYLNLAIMTGFLLHEVLEDLGVMLPYFVPCLIMGIVIANLRAALFPKAPPVSRTASLALISEFALGAFLAMSLMSLQLWTIAELGPAIAVTLALQTLFTVVFVVWVLFPVMGRTYDAAVLAAGFGGFALGATPTAIANMTAVTKRYGPSPIAFIVLPLVSAFFVDIANAIVIQMVLNF